MHKKHIFLGTIITSLLLGFTTLSAQGSKIYDGPDDPAADILAERDGTMNGNNVLLYFRNTTELSDCCNLGYWVSRWPNDYSGSKMHDGICILLGARVYLENDTIPVTDMSEIQSRTDLDTLYFCQSSFRVYMDKNPEGTLEWALYPVFGYFNVVNPHPAMSNKPDSWPVAGWPAAGDELKWQGVWNGRFGLGEMRADLETYFVANDAQDQEWLGPEDVVKYYPRPGVKIGDKRPEVSVQKGLPWGGVGLRVEVRGFQWKNPEAADCIFWEYSIANISDYDIPEMYFGYQIDNAIGGEEYDAGATSADDVAYYNKDLEMCFSWDLDGQMIGGGGVPGCMGIAFLESPGIPDDNIDNDEDGVIDEQRDNPAGQWVSPMTGVDNLADWNRFRGIEDPADTSTIRWHWEGDEDQDWRDGIDLNGNGTYAYQVNGSWLLEEGENPGDDVGTDGSGPFDLDYPGPDANGTEGNHKPDLEEGVGSEPNFGYTDVGESDMLGLTTFKYLLEWQAGTGGPRTAADDESIFLWLMENDKPFDEFQGEPKNFIEQFASGIFTLYKGRTERISMSELHALERLHEQTAPPFTAPALYKLKQVVQAIYESDYQFAQPPIQPALTATPGDGKIVLSWDNIAEEFTNEPLLGNINDFEGYKLYKSTDPFMSDNKNITDGFGTIKQIKPLFQCDIVDDRKGFTDFGYLNGAGFYLGDDTGIRNYYIDTDVENGRTYYYVLVAYDYGIKKEDVEVGPSENTYTIDLNPDETINSITRNVAIAVPHQLAAGYVPPEIKDLDYNNSFGKNIVNPEIIVSSFLRNGHEYKVKFGVDTSDTRRYTEHGYIYRNETIDVYDMTAGDSLVYHEDPDNYTGNNYRFYREEANFTDVQQGYEFDPTKELVTTQFDGLVLKYFVPTLEAQFDSVNSGWIVGNSEIEIIQPIRDYARWFCYDFDIIFTEDAVNYNTLESTASIFDERLLLISGSKLLIDHPLPFYVLNRSVKDSAGNYWPVELVVHDVNDNDQFDWMTDRILVGFKNTLGRAAGRWGGLAFIFHFRNVDSEELLPNPGDSYHVTFLRGFTEEDSVTFRIEKNQEVDKKSLQETMDKITVVPNPYVVTNTMEPAVGNWDKNQSRRILFTNIPAQCTIKIFTITGILIDVIEVDNFAQTGPYWDTNSEANGTVHWDVLTKEGLDVAPGYYLYHVKSKLTGDEKIGKFAIIK